MTQNKRFAVRDALANKRKKKKPSVYNLDRVKNASPVKYEVPENTIELPAIEHARPAQDNLISKNPLEAVTNPNQADGVATRVQQVPQNTPLGVDDFQNTNTVDDFSSKLTEKKTQLETDIDAMTQRMANLPQAQIDAKKKLGIYEDEKELAKMREKLSGVKQQLEEAVDNQTLITEQGKQFVSDFAGTDADLGQRTNADLRKNRLDQLVASRTYSRLGGAINDYQASIDSTVQSINERADAEQKKLEFDITQKNKVLDRVIQQQGAILSNKQKQALEEVKLQNQLTLLDKKADVDNKRSLVLEGIKQQGAFDLERLRQQGSLTLQGVKNKASVSNARTSFLGKLVGTSGLSNSDMSRYANMDYNDILNDLLSKSPNTANSWLSYTKEEAFTKLDKEQFTRWEKYNGLDKERMKEKAQQEAVVSSSADMINLIDDMIGNDSGLGDSVGTWLGSVNLNPINQAEVNRFRKDLKGLGAVVTLDTLKNLKKSGATLGAISEKELAILSDANTRLGLLYDDQGKLNGRSNLSEDDFKSRLREIQEASIKVNILNDLGRDYFDQVNVKNLSQEALRQLYSDIQNGTAPEPRGDVEDETVNFLKEVEGFSQNPYQDITGKWTTGYGDTKNANQSLTQEEAERRLRQRIGDYQSWGSRLDQSKLTNGQKVALTSFEYNLGSGIWDKSGKPIIESLNNGDINKAVKIMAYHDKARVNGKLQSVQGLRNRRIKEIKKMLA